MILQPYTQQTKDNINSVIIGPVFLNFTPTELSDFNLS